MGYKQIRDFAGEDFKVLDDYWITLAKFTGINPAPEAEDRDRISAFVRDMYPSFTLKEVDDAVRMALTYKLKINKDHDPNNYNKFSAQWISSILNAYQEHRNSVMIKYTDAMNKKQLEADSQLSEEEQNKIMVEAIKKSFNEFKENPKQELVDIGNSMYNFLTRHKVLLLTDKQKHKLMDRAKQTLLEKKKRKKSLAKTIKAMEIQKSINEIIQDPKGTPVQAEAKRLVIQDFFKHCVAQNVPLIEKLQVITAN